MRLSLRVRCEPDRVHRRSTEDAAQHALENWISSPGHFETMIDPDGDSIGVGVTERDGVTYCYLFVGCPNTHNPYE